MNLRRLLDERISAALREVTGDPRAVALVAPSAKAQFGDYQANGVMAAAKRLKTNPQALARQVHEKLKLDDLAEKVEIAGPGFLNITLKPQWLAGQLNKIATDTHLGAEQPDPRQRIVVDYSAPNLAKEMHVGHLRSTIIGDAMARILDFLGHEVIRQNHVGDWGTQFGMLIAYMERVRDQVRTEDLPVTEAPDVGERYRRAWKARRVREPGDKVNLDEIYRYGDPSAIKLLGMHALVDLEDFYRRAKELFDHDPNFAKISKENVVKLQSGDARCHVRWLEYTLLSLDHCNEVYKRLGALLTNANVRSEAAYNDDLPNVVADLKKAGLLSESQGAQCVFLPEFVGKDGPLPLIIQKSDEGFLYATTDLAAIRYRVRELKADRILYVVDARQSLHFRQVFAVARKAEFAPETISLEHVAFGTMMGSDGKPFKTRTGGTVKLMDLLDESEKRAFELVSKKNPDLPEDLRREIARKVGVGAVKYADLSQNRNSDYVFSWDKMLALDGNTAPYMQYAYARIQSIFRKDEKSAECEVRSAKVMIAEPAERILAMKLLQFPETLATVSQECLPNLLCAYLYDLAVAFTGFYENCPVLQSSEPTRAGRLALCRLTADVIARGLDLLGIQTVEQM